MDPDPDMDLPENLALLRFLTLEVKLSEHACHYHLAQMVQAIINQEALCQKQEVQCQK